MSLIQNQAIATFTTMLNRAIAYRNDPNSVSEELFYPRYGICDNINRCKPDGADGDIMSRVKDNVIRRVPSYSGNYHYPVPAVQPFEGHAANAAECAYDYTSNRWADEYGAERVKQLTELLDHVTNKWDESISERMSPAKRVGIIQGVTLCKMRSDSSMWVLHSDDDSADPYFTNIDTQEQRAISLQYLDVLPVEEFPKRSVSSFVKRMSVIDTKRIALELKISKMKAEVEALNREEHLMSFNLGRQHGVKRIKA